MSRKSAIRSFVLLRWSGRYRRQIRNYRSAAHSILGGQSIGTSFLFFRAYRVFGRHSPPDDQILQIASRSNRASGRGARSTFGTRTDHETHRHASPVSRAAVSIGERGAPLGNSNAPITLSPQRPEEGIRRGKGLAMEEVNLYPVFAGVRPS